MSFKPYLAYSASAGSGKTFALAVRYISLLFMGESASSILAATFTNKAAAEMRQRVVDSLRGLGREENDAFLAAILRETGLSQEALLEKQPEVLTRFLSSSAHIVTLDSFFASILRSASLEIGLEPDFVTKEQGTEALEQFFLDEVQANGLLRSLVKLAMDIEDKRFGKIFAMMQHFYTVDPLLPDHAHPPHTMKALEEEIETTRAALQKSVIESGASKTAIENFSPAPIKILSSKSVFSKESLLEHRNYKKYVQKNPEIDTLYLHLKALLGEWMSVQEAVVLQNLFRLYDEYKNATIRNAKYSGVLSFDDLSYFTYRLLYESMSREFLYFKIDAKFKHILLDEFQDTSTLQFLLLQPLIDEIFSGQGQSEFKSFFYVGDTKQSLYRFRGGVEELFDRVAQTYDVGIELMDTNYRSAKAVVAQVNHWFAPVMQGYVAQKSRPTASEGYVEVVESEEVIEEAIGQAQRLITLGVNSDAITFLVSTNKDGQNLQEACAKEGIHTLLKTSSSLKNLPKIAALVAMVEYLFVGDPIDAKALLQKVNQSIETVDLSWFSCFMSPLEVVDRVVREFGYFEEDQNILKLLQFASNYTDIPTFLEEFQSSSIAVASNSVHGAKIMTVHGSKGLEFAYVIVLDKLTRPNSDKSALLYHYHENLMIDQILYRMKGREYFDSEYAQIVAKRKEQSTKDQLNVLYVALTRAVEGMIIVKKPKESMFAPLGMEEMRSGHLIPSKQDTNQRVEQIGQKRPSVSISHYGIQEVVQSSEDEEKDYEAILFGTALHYTLEMLEDFSFEALHAAMLSLQNRYGAQLDIDQREEIQRRISMLIENTAFTEMLQGAIVHKEQALSYQGERKQIDLLLEYGTYHRVVEYKSSQKYALKHQEQVQYYQQAIGKISQQPVHGVIVYLLAEGIELFYLNNT